MWYAFLISGRLNGGLPKVFNASIIGFGNPVGFAAPGFPTPWMRGSELGFGAELDFAELDFAELGFAELGFAEPRGLGEGEEEGEGVMTQR